MYSRKNREFLEIKVVGIKILRRHIDMKQMRYLFFIKTLSSLVLVFDNIFMMVADLLDIGFRSDLWTEPYIQKQ